MSTTIGIVVAIIGAVIAWGQFSLARTRTRHDLYDRRYRIYEGARRLVAEIVREGRATNQDVFAFRRETGDSVFLLNEEIVTYMTELQTRAFRLAYLGTIITNDIHPDRNAAIDEEAKLLTWFTEQFDVLVIKFKPLLHLDRPWWS